MKQVCECSCMAYASIRIDEGIPDYYESSVFHRLTFLLFSFVFRPLEKKKGGGGGGNKRKICLDSWRLVRILLSHLFHNNYWNVFDIIDILSS